MTPHASSKVPYAFAIGGGALLWLATSALSGRNEAWDSSLYWSGAYPLSILLAGALGYAFAQRPWRWGLAVMLAQAATLALTSGDFSLLPLGLILFGILALPAVGVAQLAARIRLRGESA